MEKNIAAFYREHEDKYAVLETDQKMATASFRTRVDNAKKDVEERVKPRVVELE